MNGYGPAIHFQQSIIQKGPCNEISILNNFVINIGHSDHFSGICVAHVSFPRCGLDGSKFKYRRDKGAGSVRFQYKHKTLTITITTH